ncbi:MAG: hypothetical protein EI684_16010 [Candidatus Viridilinea halotolerans]|uniref:Uncharacterized protein n=1 Tax=Candidatus Viridilinea halotolerans TaxID=2491704 RepID=A0A426TV82_9CHLR|nr:MAG: hypothetical protein EI684_16010 [Candidatus Viridilinea halotolerans]
MNVEFIACPNCKQRLGVIAYVVKGSLVVCANPRCGTSLRVVSRKPLHVEVVPEAETYQVDYRPESYG